MNERIRELAEQADIIQWDTLPSGARTPDHESVVKAKKFAELIAYECIDLALGSSHREDDMGAIIANKIKKHFGVEE